MKLLLSLILFCALGVYAEEPVTIAGVALTGEEAKSLNEWTTNVANITTTCMTYLDTLDQVIVKKELTKIRDMISGGGDTEPIAQTTLYNWLCDNRGKIKVYDKEAIFKTLVWFRYLREKGWNPPHSVRTRITAETLNDIAAKLQEWMSESVTVTK